MLDNDSGLGGRSLNFFTYIISYKSYFRKKELEGFWKRGELLAYAQLHRLPLDLLLQKVYNERRASEEKLRILHVMEGE